MNITRVHTKDGSHIEPPLDARWNEPTKLAWCGAIVAHDTGLTIQVEPQPSPDTYSITIADRISTSAYTYREAWVYLQGVSTGHKSANRTS